MRLIAIATLYVGKSLKGLRLLEVESKNVRDVDKDILIDGIQTGAWFIENIEVRDNKLVGTNGKLSNLPVIKDGWLVGASPMIVLNKIGKEGYLVTNYTGKVREMSREDTLKYAKENGVANCKINAREGNSYLSGIRRGIVDIKVKDKKPKNDLYTGELLGKGDIKGIITGESIEKPELAYKGDRRNYVLNYTNNSLTEIKVQPTITNKVESNKNTIKLGADKYKIFGNINYEIKHKDITVELVRELYKYADITYRVNNSIDKEIGFIMVVCDKKSNTNIPPDSMIKNTVDYMKEHKVGIVIKVGVNEYEKNFIMCRECSKSAIKYYVRGIHGLSIKTIEEIYKNKDEYENLECIGDGKFDIYSLDGHYRYDIDKINETYKNNIITTKKTVKAKMFDHSYEEVINNKNELIRLNDTKSKVIKIDDRVEVIKKESIVLNTNIREIVFGENIKRCNRGIIVGGMNKNNNLRRIVVNSKSILDGLVDSIVSNIIKNGIDDYKIEIVFNNRDINYKEYGVYVGKSRLNNRRKVELIGNIDRENRIKAYKYAFKKYINKGSEAYKFSIHKNRDGVKELYANVLIYNARLFIGIITDIRKYNINNSDIEEDIRLEYINILKLIDKEQTNEIRFNNRDMSILDALGELL